MINRIEREKETPPDGIKGFLYWWMESEQNSQRYVFDLFISVIILFSVFIIILDISYGSASDTPTWVILSNNLCLFIFIVEYLLRFWVNTDFLADWREETLWYATKQKLLWMVQPFSLIDLIAIIPVGALRSVRIFRFFRLARLLRFLKLGRYSAGFSGFLEELKNRSYELLALSGVVCAVIFIGATAIFAVEGPDAEGSLVTNFGDAIWWAAVTTTTVGYGDIYPKSFAGRSIAVVLMLTSIGIVGALGGILTSAMMERIRKMREGQIERITFQNHIVFCGWTACAKKVAQMLDQTDLLDYKQLIVINEQRVPELNYLLGLEGDFTKPANLDLVNTGDADVVVVFYQTNERYSPREADRRSVLTALEAEQYNPDEKKPYTITEVYDPESARLITGQDIQGDETLDKEGFDANLILNTIQYPGHTTRIFYNLSNFTDQWIQLKDTTAYFSDDELPVRADQFRKMVLDRQLNITFLGVLEENENEAVINPPADYQLTENTSLYVIEKSPYPREEEIEYQGYQQQRFDISHEPLYAIEENFVFLGLNRCAEHVLKKLEQSRWVDNNRKVIVVSEKKPPEKPWIEHIEGDFSNVDRIRKPDWWSDKKVAIIFHEEHRKGAAGTHSSDIKNAITSLVLPEDVRVIAEIVDEDYARVLQKDIKRDIELIYKERFDANLIANSILNEGDMSEFFRELGTLAGNQLRSFAYSHFVSDREEIRVMTFRRQVLDREDRMTFLGMLKQDEFQPRLNPSLDETIEPGDILYFITRGTSMDDVLNM